MKISKPTAIFLSVISFVITAGVFAVFVGTVFKGFSFAENPNPIMRIVFLGICFFIARKYYDFIYKDVKNKEGKQEIAVYSEPSDRKRKIAIGAVVLIFIIAIVYVSIGVIFFSSSTDEANSTQTILHYNDSQISFNYSSDWTIESNNSTDIAILDNKGFYLHISIDNTDGYSLNQIYDIYKSSLEENENVTIINSSNIAVNNVSAIEIYSTTKISDPNENSHSDIKNLLNIDTSGIKYNSYDVIMVENNKYFIISYSYAENSLNEEFKTFINSFKIV
ncbi:MAG: hypothetical protein LBM96_13260 [Methanobrevibacter sp.]|jgi:hypothetical protein|nr:hypothetical protein [Candidatus Methanoflexus mossambicus]